MARCNFILAVLIVAASVSAQDGFVCGSDEAMLQSLAKPAAPAVVSGTLKILVLRVAFKDKSFSTDTAAMGAADNRVVEFYRDNSNRALTLSFRHYPSVLKAPETGQTYADNWDRFADFIWGKLSDLGLSKGRDYDRFVVDFPSIKLPWLGLSSGPGSGANYINGDYNAAAVAHELGHALGLPHATALEAGKRSVGSGSDGERIEYGDAFDVMGRGGILGHFNTLFKRRLGWISSSELLETSASGVFRLYAHDNPARIGKPLALRLAAGNGRYTYWIEYRTSYSSNYVNTRGSAGIRLEDYFTGGKSALLDLTPDSRSPEYDFNDAGLEVGKEFQDPYGAFKLRVVGVNSGEWDEGGWVEAQVTWSQGSGLFPIDVGGPSSVRLPAAQGPASALQALTVDARGRLLGVRAATTSFALPAAW